ncbi:hypothetical protein [Thermococcus sp.]
MKAKPIVLVSFIFLALYFLGLAVLSVREPLMFGGFIVISIFHLGFAIGINRGYEAVITFSPYIALLDFLFGLLWIMLGLSMPAITLTLISALLLFVLLDEDVRTELKS